MYYQPPRALGLLVGAVITLWAASLGLILLNNGLALQIGPGQFLSHTGALAAIVVAVLFGYWSFGLATLSYSVDRNGLVIAWGSIRQVIPLGAIERLVPGTAVGVPPVRGVSWWGYHIGKARIDRIGEVLFYSTHQTQQQLLYVMTEKRNYAISVDDPADFAREIQTRQELGPTADVTHHVERYGAASHPLFRDRLAQILIFTAVMAGILVWGQVALLYGDLPAMLELHFPPAARTAIVTVVSRDAILSLPRTALLILTLNLVLGLIIHGWNRAAGYVLFIGATVAQLAFMVAMEIALR